MYTLIIFLIAISAISFMDAPNMGAGWAWDANNALGFAALAGMLYLTTPGGARRDVRGHEWLGYAVLFVTLMHALWFLLVDGAAVEYLKPGAPAYMWAGICGLLLLAVLAGVAVTPARLRIHKSYNTFRYWHQTIAVVGIGFSVYHIIASGFYLRTWFQAVLLIVVAIAAMFGRGVWNRLQQSSQLTPVSLLMISFIGAAVFSLVRNLD